jgi:hypothetical protein
MNKVLTENFNRKPEATMPSKGYRERLKAAKDINEARTIMADVRRQCPDRYIKRCQRVFDQLPFTKEQS